MEDVNMHLVGLGNTRISTDNAHKSPWTLSSTKSYKLFFLAQTENLIAKEPKIQPTWTNRERVKEGVIAGSMTKYFDN